MQFKNTPENDAYRKAYREYRTGASKGAKGDPVGGNGSGSNLIQRKKISMDNPLAKSAIFSHSAEADAIRLRFEEWHRVQAHSLIESTAVATPHRRRRQSEEKDQSSRQRVLLLVVLALVCGSLCQLCVELLTQHDGRLGNVISATEYTYCALLSSSALLTERRLPWSSHLQLWSAGVAHSALTNVGLGVRGLPMPVALVIKNGSLLANMLVGAVVGKRPTRRELVAAAVVSAGLVLGTTGRGGGAADGGASNGSSSTIDSINDTNGSFILVGADGSADGGIIAPASEDAASPPALMDADPVTGAADWGYTIGVCALSGALLARASSGILQERIFERHGVAYNEVLFWRAALGAPVFFLHGAASLHIGGGAGESRASSPLADVLGSYWLLGLLLTNVVGDHLCKVAVTRLIGEAGSLVATLVICVQRFASCVFSAAVLAPHPPPASLWWAIGLVALGSLLSIPPAKEGHGKAPAPASKYAGKRRSSKEE